MKAILRTLGNDEYDLNTFVPEEANIFNFLLNLSIGPIGENGTNYFQVRVCTPEWLCKHHWLPELMRHTLLVRKYDLDEITKTITDYIDQCEGNDWMDIAQKLSRVFAWEYEDYQP
ncbi:immunity 8 family protein [Enterobacteriaceae bacterium H18W14]|uniref:immunity 8 family protein n=1 Tax=Dryocola boscaweniae TaxID=2925397 RepID=UPI0022F10AC8|nr:immunity 8 family protein [Dryocola boscaweniae]MCT4714501.1 immunity 8 family protein [Dryocola boscaweniae]